MKKLLLLFAVTAFLWSCGDDDGGGSGPKPSIITLQTEGGEPLVRTFTYDNKNRIQTLSSEGTTYTFIYDNKGQVASITQVGEDPILFTYAQNGDLQSFSSGDSVYTVAHNDDNTFTVSGQTFAYLNNGDWSKFDAYNFTYGSGKGPFANVKGINGMAIAIIDSESFLYAARKRLNTISIEGSAYPVTATQGDAGLPDHYQVSVISMDFDYSN